MKTVISMCDHSGVMVEPWALAGYECIIVDLLHPAGSSTHGNVTRVGANMLHYLPAQREYAAAFAFPMCKNLAVSGDRWFKDKGLRGLIEGLELVERCRQICEWTSSPWMLENPVSTLSSYWRKPDHIFNPCDFGGYLIPFGDAYTKKTCLWTGAGFQMPIPKPVEPTEGSKMHLLPPSEDRDQLRSITPAGFAQAVFEANHRSAA